MNSSTTTLGFNTALIACMLDAYGSRQSIMRLHCFQDCTRTDLCETLTPRIMAYAILVVAEPRFIQRCANTDYCCTGASASVTLDVASVSQ